MFKRVLAKFNKTFKYYDIAKSMYERERPGDFDIWFDFALFKASHYSKDGIVSYANSEIKHIVAEELESLLRDRKKYYELLNKDLVKRNIVLEEENSRLKKRNEDNAYQARYYKNKYQELENIARTEKAART